MKVFILLSVVTLLASCGFFGERVSGNGHVITQQRSTTSFNSVEARGSMNIHVRQDSAASVKIETDENLMQYIDVFIQGNTLVIKNKDGYNLNPSKDIIVYVSAPVFHSLNISGSGDLISENSISAMDELNLSVSGSGAIKMDVRAPKVVSDISGSGDMILKGSTKDLSVGVSGSGSIKCFDLAADNVSVELSGSSDAQVTANQKLNVQVSGSGSVQYKGNASVNQRVSGSGSVEKVS